INDARKEAKEILEGVNAKIERTILEIRNASAEKEKTKELRKDLAEFKSKILEGEDESADKNVPKALAPLKHKSRHGNKTEKKPKVAIKDEALKVGDYVKLDGNSTVGKILSIQGKKAEVAFGSLRTLASIDKLKATSKPKEQSLAGTASYSTSTSDESRKRQLNFKNEIDVRGMRADEALQAVTYFLDDAVQFSISRVRILHGTGHGILKTLIREQLRANSAVSHFEDEDIRFGGAGITVVDLE
ncbi:MAG: Smr/MutS family protein, partial [Muribaculaceae bacterium]|nr:Smr/MutS family protein [Muribaculaceae bacterium]